MYVRSLLTFSQNDHCINTHSLTLPLTHPPTHPPTAHGRGRGRPAGIGYALFPPHPPRAPPRGNARAYCTMLSSRRSPSCAPGCTWRGSKSFTDRCDFPGSGHAAVVGVVGTCSVSWCAADSSPAPVTVRPGGQRGYPGGGGASFLAARAWLVPVSWQPAHAAALQTLPRRCCPAVSGSGVPAPFPRIQ